MHSKVGPESQPIHTKKLHNESATSGSEKGATTSLPFPSQEPPNTQHFLHGHGLREMLPQIMNEQNRKTFGTWQRKYDFTRTIIGYLLGIHSFFRVPYLCYKFGGIFFIPYVIMMQLVAVPVVFMEFTIGQYYGVCSYVAFTHMSPILSCVSKLLTWSCVVNCWMYAVMMAWLRVYASDSTSCLKGWEICDQNHFFNSPHCWTGIADDNCNNMDLAPQLDLDEGLVMGEGLLYYNYKCRSVKYYCEQQGWKAVPGKPKICMDDLDIEHTIYERRYHAIQEYFYGSVLGLKRNMEDVKKEAWVNETLALVKTDIHGLRKEIYGESYGPNHELYNKTDKDYQVESVRIYMKNLERSKDKEKKKQFQQILDNSVAPKYQKLYWTTNGQQLTESEDSSSYISLKHVSVTTWITIAVFLFEDLLKISFLSYVLNAFPFTILIYVTVIVCRFENSWNGIGELFTTSEAGFWSDLWNADMWAEATVQAIYASGIGSGCLISLATFNSFDNNFLFDIYFTLGLSLVSACCGVLISFGSIGHYLRTYGVQIPFKMYVKSGSSVSSIEFCFIAYSHFLTLKRENSITILWFFFMITSFATDTAVRLIQNVLDTIHSISPRLKHHSTMVLVAVCVMGYLILVPVMKNGGYVLFIDFEYFVTKYMMPTIVAIEVGAVVFVYRASRLVDHAEQMGLFDSYFFRVYMTSFLHIACGAVVLTVLVNVSNHQTVRFNDQDSEEFLELFGWVFFVSPFLMAILSILKHLIVIPADHRQWLLVPLQGKDRKKRRAFLRRLRPSLTSTRKKTVADATDQEQIRAAAARMRVMESKFILAMMQRRREEQERKQREQQREGSLGENNNVAHQDAQSQSSSLPPLFASLVRVAAAEFGEKRQSASMDPRKSAAASSRKSRFAGFIQSEDDDGGGGLRGLFTCGKCWRRKEDEPLPKRDEVYEEQEEEKEQSRIRYLDMMDSIERWPGRLDESDIESEGSSVEGSDTEIEQSQPDR